MRENARDSKRANTPRFLGLIFIIRKRRTPTSPFFGDVIFCQQGVKPGPDHTLLILSRPLWGGREQRGRRGVVFPLCSRTTRPPSALGPAGRKFYFPPSQALGSHSTSVKRKVLLSAPTSAKLLTSWGKIHLALRGVCPPAYMLLFLPLHLLSSGRLWGGDSALCRMA